MPYAWKPLRIRLLGIKLYRKEERKLAMTAVSGGFCEWRLL
jgi:hypothetical protein